MQWFRKAEDILEPVGSFTYNGKEYPTFASVHGSYKPMDPDVGKRNRYAKIGKMADQATQTLRSTIDNEPVSPEGRLAYACLLMMTTGIRVGNESSAEGYESALPDNVGELVQTFGTTTLKPEHVDSSEDGKLKLQFLGKKQVDQNIEVNDPLLNDVGRLYLHDARDTWIGIELKDLVRYIKNLFGDQMIPKDLRAFHGNTLFVDLSRSQLNEDPVDKKTAKAELKQIIEQVAEGLGNTPGVTRSAYLDSLLLDWYVTGRITELP